MIDTSVTVVEQKGGVDMYGLYAEGVISYKAAGTIQIYRRAFLVGKSVYRYDRQPGKKSTVWKGVTLSTVDAARERFFRYFHDGAGTTCSMRGEPLLVQLKLTDILEMDRGKAPASRYVGGAKIEAAIGKFDEVAWVAETKKRNAEDDPAETYVGGAKTEAPTAATYPSASYTAPMAGDPSPVTPTSPRGVDKSLPLNWKEILSGK